MKHSLNWLVSDDAYLYVLCTRAMKMNGYRSLKVQYLTYMFKKINIVSLPTSYTSPHLRRDSVQFLSWYDKLVKTHITSHMLWMMLNWLSHITFLCYSKSMLFRNIWKKYDREKYVFTRPCKWSRTISKRKQSTKLNLGAIISQN